MLPRHTNFELRITGDVQSGGEGRSQTPDLGSNENAALPCRSRNHSVGTEHPPRACGHMRMDTIWMENLNYPAVLIYRSDSD